MSDTPYKGTELVFVKTRYDEEFAERIRRNTGLVKEDKDKLLKRAEDYSTKYEREIEEGTKKKQLLLSAGGVRSGDNEAEAKVMQEYGKFLPTKYTPILNLLYFMLREEEGPDWMAIKQDFDQKFGGSHDDDGLTKEQLESKYGAMMHEEPVYDKVKEPEEMDRFIYGNCSHETFRKIKKLKALSKSGNHNEAFLAYRMCLKLCEKHNLEFDKIPCNIEGETI